MKRTSLLLAAALALQALPAAGGIPPGREVKNVILMISDGTSLSTLSLARWMQFYADSTRPKLNIDPYLCGTVRTSSSDAPIGDSAPTTSCYMTGQPSVSGFVATCPPSRPGADLFPVDTARAYRPALTLLEAARLKRGAATGLVFTCEFPHATPADCSAHSYDRNRYDWIVPQMASGGVDVLIGGGTSLLTAEAEAGLLRGGWSVLRDDLAGMRADTSRRMWALFGEKDMAYDLDRDTASQPSLAEMTATAISRLNRDPDGFFLMVEGSKVDWAAHDNDPAGLYSEFLAFDRAVGVALDFARRDGHTAVVITADHGNSGLSIGRRSCKGYDRLTKHQLFGPLSRMKRSAEGIARLLNTAPRSEAQDVFRKYAGITLTDEELDALDHCEGYRQSPLPAAERKAGSRALYSSELDGLVARILTRRTCLAFTTDGHTGEDVFLAAYHPQGDRPTGMLLNIELAAYLASLYGFGPDSLRAMSDEFYAPHTEVFAGMNCRLIPATDGRPGPTLIVTNPHKKDARLEIDAFSSTVRCGRRARTEMRIATPAVWVDKRQTFYLPASLADALR